MTTIGRIVCFIAGHKYRVVRRMNPGARKVTCDRCHATWGMHDQTRAFVPWDSQLEAMYAPGGPLDPEHYKG
jgi:hypothetical protein